MIFYPLLAPGYIALFPNQVAVNEWGEAEDVNSNIIRINHYWSRDRKYFDEVKTKGVTDHAKNKFFLDQFITDTFNRSYDPEILRFVSKLRKKMNLK